MEQNNQTQIAIDFKNKFTRLHEEIGKVIVGYEEIIENVLIALFAGGHVLLEGVPGLGKTVLVKTLSQVLDAPFSRIQFTPDLMPADILGTNLIVETEGGKRAFQFQQGPIFANIILADEINRATPKTQSALLECMQEKTVTITETTRVLDKPFFVLGTQNPLEMEGTYPLPEAQLDRFMFKLWVPSPTKDSLNEILRRTTEKVDIEVRKIIEKKEILEWGAMAREVFVTPDVRDYASQLVLATHPNSEYACEETKRYVRYGSSPRGGQALINAAKIRALVKERYNVSFEDIAHAAKPALRHRIIMNFEGEAERISTDQIIDAILKHIKTQEPIKV